MRHYKLTLKDRIARTLLYIISIIVLLVAAYPLYYVVIASFSDPNALANGEVWLIPKEISLSGYKKLGEYTQLWVGYRNTILYTIFGTLLAIVVTIPAAFAMSRKKAMLRNGITIFFTIPMFFGGGMIPTYILMKNLHLLDNPLVMILPGCFGVYNMIIARTFMQNNIPEDLYDAASVDGCGNVHFFVKMVLPLSKAIIAVIVLYVAVGIWNSYFNALLYMQSKKYQPLQLALRDILISNDLGMRTGETSNVGGQLQQRIRDLLKYCVIVVSTLPIMCVYPFLQKYFAKGVMIGSIKG